MSLRDDILQADDLEREQVHVPEWDLDVWVRGLTAAERDAYEAEVVQLDDAGDVHMDRQNARAKLVVKCTVDEDGQRVFEPGDVDLLGEKSGKAVDRLFDAAQRLSGITEEDLDELVGKSENGPPAGSPTD